MKPESASDFGVDSPGLRYGGAVAELNQRWQRGTAPLLEDFLQESEWADRISERALVSLISLDQRERWRRGQRPAAEEYLQRFPQLAADDELALDVIYGEFLLREELSEQADVRDFQARFPEFGDTLLDQIDFHRAMAADSPWRLSEHDTHRSAPSAQLTNAPGTRLPVHLTHFVPGYEILSEIGRGGMGIVYRARQLSLNRLVALKMLRAGDCGSAALLARFQAEAEAVARLHHPNIVQIYDYGEHEGMPYLALELIEGGPLSALHSGKARNPREAAEIVGTLARAVQFAHEQGIVHRDLKPGNVLVSVPAADSGRATIKITDFGLAKLLREGEENHTQTGTIVGTPSYMAPEQARGRSQLVGPATDVYALGAILYELLTGQPPFKALTAIETLHQVLTIEAVSPKRHVQGVPRDLATIVLKCLQKDPQRRYSSAAKLADDLEHFLDDRPVRAHPVTAAERSWRWCRRNPVLASLAGSVALLLIVVAAVSSFYSWRLSHQLSVTSTARQAEGEARKLAEIRLWDSYLAEIDAGRGSQRLGTRTAALTTIGRANELLDRIGRTPQRVLKLRNATIATLAKPDLREERIVAITPWVTRLSFSVAADRYAGVSESDVTVHRLSTAELLHTIPRDPAVSPNSTIPRISADGRFVSTVSNRDVKIWRCEGNQPELIGKWEGATRTSFSPDSNQAIVFDPAQGLSLIDLESGTSIWNLAQRVATSDAVFHEASRRIAVCTKSGVCIIDSDTGGIVVELPEETAGGLGIAWHPAGEAVAVSGLNEGIVLWDVVQGRRLTYFQQRGYVICSHFSRDGNFLLTQDDWSGEMQVWNTGTGEEVLRSGSIDRLTADVSASPGDFFIQMQPDRLVLWRIVPGLVANPLLDAPYVSLGDVYGIAISPDGRLLAIGRWHGFDVWDLVTHRRVSHAGSQHCGPAFEPNGDLLVACRWGLCRWRRQTLTDEIRFGPPQILSEPLVDMPIGLSSDGSVAAIKSKSGWQLLQLHANNRALRVRWAKDARGASVSPDGAWLSLANWSEEGVNIWDAASGQHVASLAAGRTGKPLFSPDGRWLATTPDGVRLWRTGDWQPGSELHAQGTTPGGLGIAFSPDSRVLAVGQPDEITRLVDPETGKCYAELRRPDSRNCPHLAFTPDQSQLIEVSSGYRGAPRIWNLVEIRRELAQRRLDWPADVLRVAPRSQSAADSAEVIVELDDGNLPNQQAAMELVAQTGKAKDARACDLLQRALQLNPDHAPAHNQLAWILVAGPESIRDAPAAVRLARRSVELDGSQATSWNTLGVALYRDGQYSQAIETLERSLQLGGDFSAGFDLIFLALCHVRQGNAPAADDYFRRAAVWREAHAGQIPVDWERELTDFFAEAATAGLPCGTSERDDF